MSYKAKKNEMRRGRFFKEMDSVLPWDKLLRLLRRHYLKGVRGRSPVAVETMLRIYFMQQWYRLSDLGIEDSLYDIEAMRRFAGVGLQTVPDETTICRFRHCLETYNLTEKLFDILERYLRERELILREGTIVGARAL